MGVERSRNLESFVSVRKWKFTFWIVHMTAVRSGSKVNAVSKCFSLKVNVLEI